MDTPIAVTRLWMTLDQKAAPNFSHVLYVACSSKKHAAKLCGQLEPADYGYGIEANAIPLFCFPCVVFQSSQKGLWAYIRQREEQRSRKRERERHTHTEGGMRESTNLCTNAHTKHYQAMLATETRLMAGRMGRDGKGREGAGRGGEGLGRKGQIGCNVMGSERRNRACLDY